MIENETQFIITARTLANFNADIVKIRCGVENGPARNLQLYSLVSYRDELQSSLDEYDKKHNPDRKGEWWVMASGKRFWPYDPRPHDIDINDIAYNLSMICRYCGSVKRFYSVAQHSVLASQVCESWAALATLLHDAAEAYLGDIIRPIKKRMSFYKKLEDGVMKAVCKQYGIDFYNRRLWREVKRADNILLSTEFRDIARCGVRISMPEEPPMDKIIKKGWGHALARKKFLDHFHILAST